MEENDSRKNVMKAIFKNPGRWLVIDAALLVLVLATGLLMARYVAARKVENEMVAAGFHFSSYALKEEAPEDEYTTGVVTFDIRNYEVENVSNISGMKSGGETTEYDLKYIVTATDDTDTVGTEDGCVFVKNEHDDPADDTSASSEEEYDEDYAYTLTCDGQNTDVHTVSIAPNGIATVGAYSYDSENTTAQNLSAATAASYTSGISVTAKSSYPYVKELTATYNVQGLAVTKEEVGGGVDRFVIETNQYEGPLKITWSANTFPSAGVNEGVYGWTVQYNAAGSNRYAKQTVEKNTTYYFEYNTDSYTSLSPSISSSSTWPLYDSVNDSWSGGATIEAGDS